MDGMIRTSFDVVSLTSILVLITLGMSVIVGMMRIFNLAQGEFVLLGALAAYLTYSWTGIIWLGIPAAIVTVALFGLVLERSLIHRFYGHPEAAFLATFAIGSIIRESVRHQSNTQVTSVPAPVEGSFSLMGVQLSSWRLVVVVVTIAVVIGCFVAVNRTPIGLVVRATLDNPGLAASSGIATNRINAGMFAFGAALAGLAGALIVPLQTLYPDMGIDNLIPMFIAVMIGGSGTFHGPLIGALLLGLSLSLTPLLTGPAFAQVLVILAAVVVMRIRPAGLVKA